MAISEGSSGTGIESFEDLKEAEYPEEIPDYLSEVEASTSYELDWLSYGTDREGEEAEDLEELRDVLEGKSPGQFCELVGDKINVRVSEDGEDSVSVHYDFRTEWMGGNLSGKVTDTYVSALFKKYPGTEAEIEDIDDEKSKMIVQ